MKKIFLLTFFTLFTLPISSQEKGLDQKIDEAFQPVSDFFNNVIFFSIGENPFVIYLLVGSAIFFTLYFGFPNIKYFMTSIRVVSGKYDEVEKDESSSKDGEVSHFQALTTAVSRDKDERRKSIENYNIIMFIGDNLGDFDSTFFDKDNEERWEISKSKKEKFGDSFILIPNLIYGDWEVGFNN